jgi:hypothetical protein
MLDLTDYYVEFTSCSGWREQFKNHSLLHNVKMSGDPVSVGVVKAASEKLIVEKNYFPEQTSVWIKNQNKTKTISLF